MATKRKKNWICFLLAALLLFASVPGFSLKAQAAGEEIPGEYRLVASSGSYELYLYEPTLSILLRNKETGKLLRSTLDPAEDDGANNKTWSAYMQSGVVLTAIQGITDTYQVDLVLNPHTLDYTYTDNGFTAKLYFSDYEFGFDVKVSLEGSELTAQIPESSIVENGQEKWIGTVSLFPFLGYTYLDSQEGYMFIPDGNGALIYLDDKDGRYATGFSQMVYGSDMGFVDSTTEQLLWGEHRTVNQAQKVMAPVFGMAHTQDQLGYLAVVEEGDERVSIEAHPNGVMVNYNRCFAKFLMRRMYVQPLNNSNSGTMQSVEADRSHTDMKVRYLLLSGEDADYAGMAVAYREYLTEKGMLPGRDDSYKTRVDFLGSDREEFLFFTRAVTMTDTDQVDEIYRDLKDNGIESLLTVYKGWQKGGMYNIPITKYKADSSIGGTGALTDLIQEWSGKGYQVYLYDDALQTNPAENNTTFNVVKKVNKRRLEISTKGYVYDTFNYLLPTRSDYLLNRFVDSCTKKGVNTLALAGISNNLFSYSYSSQYYSRFYCADIYRKTVEKMTSGGVDLVLEAPFAYLWDQTGAYLDMPMGSSDYMYEDLEVPFFSMVLKGSIPMYSEYVNFEANKSEFFLQMVEAGVYPSFYLTAEDSSNLIYTNSADLYSTKYTTYKDTLISYDRELRALAEKTGGACIADHEILEEGVNKVTYDNGTVIYVNYNDRAVSADGVSLDPLSYKVEAGE